MKENIAVGISIYLSLVFLSSVLKAGLGTNHTNFCKVNVPIDYIIYDRLFCEIEK